MKFVLLFFMSLPVWAGSYSGTFQAHELDKDLKPIYELEIEYQIQINGDEDIIPALSELKTISSGFSAHTLLATFFAKPQSPLLVYATKSRLEAMSFVESSTGLGKKRYHFQSVWTVVDQNKTDEAFRQTMIVNENELHFDLALSQMPLVVTVCVGQDRPVLRSVKPLGCQDVSSDEWQSGSVVLREIDWKEMNPQRSLVYFFNWRIDGQWISGIKNNHPYIDQ